MSCNHARGSFSDHLDGVPVTGFKGLTLRLHLAFCPRCRRFYRSLQATVQALQGLRDEPADPPKTP
jgi:predicted anti-sigma-YlaC factor YlaD